MQLVLRAGYGPREDSCCGRSAIEVVLVERIECQCGQLKVKIRDRDMPMPCNISRSNLEK